MTADEKRQKEASRKQLYRQNNPDEKRQKETSRKQLYRQTNPDKYTLEKEKKAQVRQSNPDKYKLEKQKKAEQQALARQNNPAKYTLEKRKDARRMQKNRLLQSRIENDTTFESICCCCVEYKSALSTTNIADCLTLGQIKRFCHRTKMTSELDNTFSICKDCKKSIKDKKCHQRPKEIFSNCQVFL